MTRVMPFALAAAWAAGAGLCSAADDMDVCALVTTAEVEAGVGAKTAAPTRADGAMPRGPLEGTQRIGCSWIIGSAEKDLKTAGSVYLSVVRLPSEKAGAGIAFRKEAAAGAKTAGFEIQEAALGEAACAVMKPPASAHGLGVATGCSVEAKGMAIAVDASGLGVKTTPEKIKAILDQAVSRLP